MTFETVNLATITLTEKEVLALREAVQYIEKLERALAYRDTDRIIRADTHEMIEKKELKRVHGILAGFDTATTYWHQYTDEEEE